MKRPRLVRQPDLALFGAAALACIFTASANALADSTSNPALGQNGHECLGVVLPADPPESGAPHVPSTGPAPPTPPTAAQDPGRSPASAGASVTPTSAAPAAATAPAATSADPVTLSLPPTTNGSPVSQNGNNIVDTMINSSALSDAARGAEIVDGAASSQEAALKAASDDQRVLSSFYRTQSPEGLADNLARAQNSSSQAASVLENATSSSMDPSERARFGNYFLNARDKAQLGLDSLRDTQQDANPAATDSPFTGLLGPKDSNPLAKSATLANIFGPQTSAASAATPDSLVNRIVMLGGLPDEQRAQALPRLKLVDSPIFTLAGGAQVSLELLHNGPPVGSPPGAGSRKISCYSLVSSALPADVRRGSFTALDYRVIWTYDRTQVFPDPPLYTPERAKQIKNTASAFIPIDPYSGEMPASGDLLVIQQGSEPNGKVMLIRGYDPAVLRADVGEVLQSGGPILYHSVELSRDPASAEHRALMPGLWVLRVRPVSNSACSYEDGKQAPPHFGIPTGTAGGAQ